MIGKAIRLIRVFHDESQQVTAAAIGISNSYLSEIENDLKTPNLELLEKIANHFGMPLSSLMFFSENLQTPPNKQRTKNAVAMKVLKLLDFIAERSHNPDEIKSSSSN